VIGVRSYDRIDGSGGVDVPQVLAGRALGGHARFDLCSSKALVFDLDPIRLLEASGQRIAELAADRPDDGVQTWRIERARAAVKRV